MLLENKNAVIYGGGGSIGGAVAREFSREGARVFLAGRTREPLETVANDIKADGRSAEAAREKLAAVDSKFQEEAAWPQCSPDDRQSPDARAVRNFSDRVGKTADGRASTMPRMD